MKLIGFCSKGGAGKTTAAEALQVAKILSFATPMKHCLKELFSFSYNQLYTKEGKEEIDTRYGVSPRVIMQRFGTEFIRSTVPNLWELLMERKLDSYSERNYIFVIDDVRFETEAELVRNKGGFIIEIVREGSGTTTHASEMGISKPDATIINNGTMKELSQQVLTTVKSLFPA